jgi:phosphonopyruvate decarboxylase
MHTATLDTGTAHAVLSTLVEEGFTFASGVPCSLLTGLFRLLEASDEAPLRYLPAPREDTAIGAASGAAVAGDRAVVLMQNSGLGYSLNVLTSFNLIYDVPILLIVSWRGYGGTDAVEHDVIGRELLNLLDVFDLPHMILDPGNAAESTRDAIRFMELSGRTTVLVVREAI